MIDNFWAFLPPMLILAYIPLVIYLDLKYREVEHYNWAVLYGIGILCTAIGYGTGYYPMILLPISFAAVTIYFILMKQGFFEGADFLFLSAISLFFVQNPFSGLVLMPVSFGIFLLAAVVSVNLILRILRTDPKFNKEFPMMIIISAAYILTLVLA